MQETTNTMPPGCAEEIDECYRLSRQYSGAVFSNETALYLLGFAERAPVRYALTFPTGYNPHRLDKTRLEPFSAKRETFELGRIYVTTPFGNTVPAYNIERTLCDLFKRRNRTDTQTVQSALKAYARYPRKNLVRLDDYMTKLHVSKSLGILIETLV